MDLWIWIIVVVAILVLASAAFAATRRARRSGSVLAADPNGEGSR